MSESPTTLQQPVPEQPKRASWRHKAALRYTRDVILSLSVSAFIIVFAYQPVKVEGTSMMPGLADQERIFINKYVYRWEAIDRGDVIVFRYPYDHTKSYIKRVVAKPGDTVEIVEGQVFVNGQKLIEPYVPGNFRDDRSYTARVIPADSYFVLGDHRNLSSDSRDFGPVSRDLIFGKAVFAYWPASKVGKLE
jgi:signal peptidase I